MPLMSSSGTRKYKKLYLKHERRRVIGLLCCKRRRVLRGHVKASGRYDYIRIYKKMFGTRGREYSAGMWTHPAVRLYTDAKENVCTKRRKVLSGDVNAFGN